MAIIQSGAGSAQLIIDETSKAARVSSYDLRGNYIGQKVTYSASVTAKTAVAAGTGVFFAIYGSSTKIIRVQKIVVAATVATAAVYGDIICFKRTAAISGGTKTDLTQVAMDSTSGSATASIVGLYTVAPTAGTGGGVIASQQAFMPITGTPAIDINPVVFDWSTRNEIESPVLRGTTQGLELSFGTTPTNAPTVTVFVIWTEE